MENKSYFIETEQKTWSQLRTLCEKKHTSCLSLRVPMNLPYSRDLVYQTPAYEMLYMPIPPRKDRRTDRISGPEDYEKGEPLLLNFLIGDPAFIPDYRLTQLSYAEDEAPILKSSFFFRDLFYEMESFTAPALPGKDPVMHIRFTIRNAGVEPYRGTVRLHLSRPDDDVMYSSYYIMARDNSFIPLNDTLAAFTEDGFSTENTARVKVRDYDGWEYAQEETYSSHPDDYRCKNYCGTHHHFFRIQQQHRVNTAMRLLKFSRDLQPRESFSFTVLFDVTGKGISDCMESYDSARVRCRKYYTDLLARDQAKFDFGSSHLNAVCKHNLFQTLQTMRDPGMNDGTLAVVQAFSCNRPMWTFEARCMFDGLLHFGFFDEARRFAELVMTWQDSECKPMGEFSSMSGAIGNTGPGWANTTGSALHLFSEYLRYSKDKSFYEKYRDNMLRAAKWILNEVAETRKKPGLASGLMPASRGTDEDVGYFFVSSDNLLLEGLFSYLDLPEVQAEQEYNELKKQTLQYRSTLRKLVEKLQRPDGFIPRSLQLDQINDTQNTNADSQCGVFHNVKGKVQFKKFDTLAGSHRLIDGRVFHPEEKITKDVFNYFEKNGFREFWTAPMDDDCVYVGYSDMRVFEYYLMTGAWKKAWGILKYLLDYGKSADLDLTVERFSLSEPAFAGVQVNESANGREFSMLIDSLYMQYQTFAGKNAIILLGGIAPFELEDSPKRMLDVYTHDGKLKLNVQDGILRFKRETPLEPGNLIRIPEHFPFKFDNKTNFREIGQNQWEILQETCEFSGKLLIKEK